MHSLLYANVVLRFSRSVTSVVLDAHVTTCFTPTTCMSWCTDRCCPVPSTKEGARGTRSMKYPSLEMLKFINELHIANFLFHKH